MNYSRWNPDPGLEDDPYDSYVAQVMKRNRIYGYNEVPMTQAEFERTKEKHETEY